MIEVKTFPTIPYMTFKNTKRTLWMNRSNYGRTKKQWDIVKYLVKRDADIEISDNYGKTPLHWAAQKNDRI